MIKLVHSSSFMVHRKNKGSTNCEPITNNQQGQILILTFIALGITLFTALFIIGGAQLYFGNAAYSVNAEKATALAEAGLDKALNSLNKTGGSYSPETETIFGDGSYSIEITNKDAQSKILKVTGYIPNKANPKIKRTVSVQVSKGEGISFAYGLQIGEGGLTMSNNSRVNGSVYSNGNITAANNARITGDAYAAGGSQAVNDQSSDCTILGTCTDFIFGRNVNGNNRLDIAQSFKPGVSNTINKISIRVKRQGSPPNITVRLLKDNNGKPDKFNVLTSGILSANLAGTQYGFIDVTFSSAPYLAKDVTYWIMLDTASDSSNYWSWSADSVQSYNRGQAKWSPNWQAGSPVWNTADADLDFKTYQGGAVTSISGSSGVIIGGDAHANTLRNLAVSGGAYYQIKENVIAASDHPGSSDPPPTVMPISESNIEDWKDAAEEAGVRTGNRIICAGTLGPGEYTGNISIPGGCTVIMTSPVWITGSLSLANNAILKLNQTSSSSGVILVDGLTTLDNNVKIEGNGNPGNSGNYLMLVSLLDSRSSGNQAVSMGNNSNTAIIYAPNGIVTLNNNNRVNELVAWRVDLGNDVVVDYNTGLAFISFMAAPTGSFSIVKGTYQVK